MCREGWQMEKWSIALQQDNISLAKKLFADRIAVGTFFESGSIASAECIGISGLDFFVVDTEHGPFEPESVLPIICAAEARGITPFVRVQDGSRAPITKMLEIGARGLIVPCIDTVAQARAIVEYGKYPPIGNRGFFMGRLSGYGHAEFSKDIDSFFRTNNESTLLIPQCETRGCLDNIEEIAGIDGIDGIFIGPYDLSIALGKPGQFDSHEFIAATERVLRACRAEKKPCFTYCSDVDSARAYIKDGYAGIAIGTDVGICIAAYKKMREDISRLE
jgi:4-hydroxy-2-oxoheptanedioate aldolase